MSIPSFFFLLLWCINALSFFIFLKTDLTGNFLKKKSEDGFARVLCDSLFGKPHPVSG